MSSNMAGLVTQNTAHTGYILLIALTVAGAAGVVIGTLYRAGAVVVGSLVTIMAMVFIGASEGWPLWRIGLVAFGVITALQIGYLLGAALVLWADSMFAGAAWCWRRVAALLGLTERKSAAKPPER